MIEPDALALARECEALDGDRDAWEELSARGAAGVAARHSPESYALAVRADLRSPDRRSAQPAPERSRVQRSAFSSWISSRMRRTSYSSFHSRIVGLEAAVVGDPPDVVADPALVAVGPLDLLAG